MTKRDPRVRDYINPVRVVWTTESIARASVEYAEGLLQDRDGQASLNAVSPCVLRTGGGILLDFGKELHGGVEIACWYMGGNERTAKLRIRFGESAMEAMSDVGGPGGATNDHAIRDQIVEVGFLGAAEIGNTGFRFVRIDLVEEDSFVQLKSIRAIFVYRDLEYKGSFKSSDSRLDRIWETGAYTVHLNMQDYLWDGIKRDRLVWIGDLHPQTSTVQAVFGDHEIVQDSLDFIRDDTPLPGWMNGIPSYSLWWVIIHYDWYRNNGDLAYLRKQSEYLRALLGQIIAEIREDGTNAAPNPFLDWPSNDNPVGVQAGLHALFTLAMDRGEALCGLLGLAPEAEACRAAMEKLRRHRPDPAGSKQAAALLALTGFMDAGEANRDVISVGGSKGVSTFYGYYLLEARAIAGDVQGAIDCIREYWGAMLDLGATTFWEDFDLDWVKDAARIDELTPEGKVDVHGAYGRFCYTGYRHSLCHGWASGPTAWLSRHVLGIEVLEPGCAAVRIEPQLGDLEWVEGKFPTPHGTIYVKHTKGENGAVSSEIYVPSGIRVVSAPASNLLR
jgi:alpha-L-rhamnosidase